MRILITGASGLVGSSLYIYLKKKGLDVQVFDRFQFSWTKHEKNIKFLSEFDCIIHAAANTNVEACELDLDVCYRDNTLLTERLVFFASQAGCRFVYISSTGIYGSEKLNDPYTEYDSVNPTTHHHRAKLLGERAVMQYSPNALILRAGWIFGGVTENPKNFVARRIEEALNSQNEKIQSNVQQRGVPTFVDDFVVKLYELIQNNEVGIFNLVNQGTASRFEYVSKIIEFSGVNTEVQPASASNFNRKAKVSDNEMAITLRLQQLGYEALPHWEESLKKYIRSDLGNWLIEKNKQ